MARILVVGAGALGGLLGALLAEKGHEVHLLRRSGPVARVRLEGGGYGADRTIDVPAAWGGAPDLVVLGVKTQDLGAALATHADAMGDAPVVGLQNGLAQDDIIRGAVGERREVSCVVALDAEYLGEDRVSCARPGTLLLGPPKPESELAARILGEVVRVDTIDNVAGARWTKLLVNLQNVVPAITGLSYQDAAKQPQLARAIVRMMKEARAVADAEGITLAPLPWTNPLMLRALSRMPEVVGAAIFQRRVAAVLGKKPAYGSTWQSVQRGQSVETEWLNGEVVRRGRARGIPTPVHARAVGLAAKGARLTPDEAGRALLGEG